MKRRQFLLQASLSSLAFSLPACKLQPHQANDLKTNDPTQFEFNENTISELQQKMKDGSESSVSITKAYIRRIQEIDHSLTHAVIELNPDALSIAESLDAERKKGQRRGPLHGIPILVKDNIDTGDKMKTSAGSLALEKHSTIKDAFIIDQLRRAGAVLLGKTNLSEWANFRSTISSSGWSSRGAQTRNPYALDRSPCGSSSGSGVAVSANLCALAIGTETDGSIVCPSGINGIVGIKPTVGLWSRDGIIPISHTQDTAGPMARCIQDAAILLGALNEIDNKDGATQLHPQPRITDYTQFLHKDGLKNARIGVLRDRFGFDKRVDILMENAIEVIQSQGAILVDPIEHKVSKAIGKYEWTVLLCEFKHGINNYLESHPEIPHQTLTDLIHYNKEHKDKCMPWFDQDIFEMADATQGIEDEKYQEALQKCQTLSRNEGIDELMNAHQLDALVAPTNGPAWTIEWVNGDHFGGGSSSLAAVAGYPNITVPAGFVQGLPIGISFFGKAWTESTLIRLAYAFEQATKHRKAPEFKNTIG
jgi:amidase